MVGGATPGRLTRAMSTTVPQTMSPTTVEPISPVSTVSATPRPTRRYYGDRVYKWLLTGLALTLPLLLVAIVADLAVSAWPSIHKFGFSFIWTSVWDPVSEVYGAAPMIFGTLVSSLLALVIAVPLSLGVAIFLTEFAPLWIRQPVAFLVELLAAIPSVVYGLWGIYVLIPVLRNYAAPRSARCWAGRRCSTAFSTGTRCSPAGSSSPS